MADKTVYSAMQSYNQAVNIQRELTARANKMFAELQEVQAQCNQNECIVNKTREALLRLVENKGVSVAK
jgi:hypothetical protein